MLSQDVLFDGAVYEKVGSKGLMRAQYLHSGSGPVVDVPSAVRLVRFLVVAVVGRFRESRVLAVSIEARILDEIVGANGDEFVQGEEIVDDHGTLVCRVFRDEHSACA